MQLSILFHLLSMSQAPDNMKRRILCLHGKMQSGEIFSNKISGARRKLARVYDLQFLDGPIRLQDGGFAWWLRDENNEHILVEGAFEHVARETEGQTYDAILGFSQGGTLATALAFSGTVKGVRAVVTAGAPFVQEAFDVAKFLGGDEAAKDGLVIPKLHFAGETDAMIPVDSTRMLSERGGNGDFVVHEEGHLFPTKAQYVNHMMDFIDKSLCETLVADAL